MDSLACQALGEYENAFYAQNFANMWLDVVCVCFLGFFPPPLPQRCQENQAIYLGVSQAGWPFLASWAQPCL